MRKTTTPVGKNIHVSTVAHKERSKIGTLEENGNVWMFCSRNSIALVYQRKSMQYKIVQKENKSSSVGLRALLDSG
jgi:hypothetical protein